MSGDFLLHVRDLHAGYGEAESVLRGVDLHVSPGECVALLGPNGVGKTTLVTTIAGRPLLRRGSVVLEGEEISKLPSHQVAGRGVTLVPEGRGMLPDSTVEENLELGAYRLRLDASEMASSKREMYARFPVLGDRRRSPAGVLSGGEQQMLAIARALMSRPRLLMLDEPSLGLAPVIVERVIEMIGELRAEGLSMLMVEQNSQLVRRVATRAYALSPAGTVHDLPPPSEDTDEDQALWEMYTGNA